jgi:hypothetical protein
MVRYVQLSPFDTLKHKEVGKLLTGAEGGIYEDDPRCEEGVRLPVSREQGTPVVIY